MISNTIRKLIEVNAEPMSVTPADLEDHFTFAINTNYISMIDGGSKNEHCREKLIEFLKRKDAWKKMDDLIGQYEGDRYKHLDNDGLLEVISKHPAFLLRYPTNFYFAVDERIYLDLQDDFDITRTGFIDRDFFTFFFAFRFSKRELERVMPFIAYHYNLTFERNIGDLKFFIESILIPKHGVLIGDARVKILTQLFSEDKTTRQSEMNPNKSSLSVRQFALKFHYLQEAGEEPLFENRGTTKADAINSVTKGVCSPNTFTQQYNLVHYKEIERLKSKNDLEAVLLSLGDKSKARSLVVADIKKTKS